MIILNAKKEARKAPIKDPRTGKVVVAKLGSGPGAEAGASPPKEEAIGAEPVAEPSGEAAGAAAPDAMTSFMEAAATTMTAQVRRRRIPCVDMQIFTPHFPCKI
ncbi:hypothetical protein GQ457_08G011520 [Hibiscus cannabinus]